ncbi:unnamed protein product [Caenorhabditis bovis]|uniref:Uncharacterized protein n=1 Tax=Caenorhabditis bovis TaxID=2654633 RepID=A0A8S1EQF1_9PELO|nr:unnamed protein product [Caenorhabditis bovis]
MLFRIIFLLSALFLVSFALVSDISHRFLHNDNKEYKQLEPIYTAYGLENAGQFLPLYEMTNSHLLKLNDLLRKRHENRT